MWHIYVDMLTLNLLSASMLWYSFLVSMTLVPPWDLELGGRVLVNYVSSPKKKCALVGPNIQLYPKQKHYNDKKVIFPIALFHSFPTVALFWQRARGSQTYQIAATCDDQFQTLSTVSAVHCSQRAVQILLESPHIPACGGSEDKFLKRAVSLLRPQFKQSRESSKRWADTMMGGGRKMIVKIFM